MHTASPLSGEHGLDHPAAHLSFSWDGCSERTLRVRLHTSCMEDGPADDFELTFHSPKAVTWEDEAVPVIQLPEELPWCVGQSRSRWRFPVLQIEGSPWVASFSNKSHLPLHHFAIMSLDDILHIAALAQPTWRWVPSIDG